MNRFFFHAILFIAILFIGLSFVSTHVEAALASDISYGHTDYLDDPLFERLPHTYGEASVENMWFANNRAYSTHTAYIGNYAGAPLDRKILCLISFILLQFGDLTVRISTVPKGSLGSFQKTCSLTMTGGMTTIGMNPTINRAFQLAVLRPVATFSRRIPIFRREIQNKPP